MKLLFVFTGGTIGSTNRGGVADVDSDTASLIAEICRKDGDEMEFAFPIDILSENATTQTLSAVLNFLLSVDFGSYDGIIVTHGSDTLAFTANLLGAALRFCKIPVVLTAANYVMNDERSNARDNVAGAYEFIRSVFTKETHYCGAFVSWKNDGERTVIHAADRLLEADAATDSFRSFGQTIGECFDGKFIENTCVENERYTRPDSTLSFLKGRMLRLSENVLLLYSYVGLDYRNIYINENVKAVVLKLYHSGTACMLSSENGGEPDSRSFAYLAKLCKSNGADLYITPAKQGSYIYSSALGFESTSAISITNKSEYAAYCTLLLAYSLEGEERTKALEELL